MITCLGCVAYVFVVISKQNICDYLVGSDTAECTLAHSHV